MRNFHLKSTMTKTSALGLLAASVLVGCQSPPKIKARGEANSSQLTEASSEQAFISFVGENPEQDTAEDFTSKLFASQLELRQGFTIPSTSNSGRCLLLLIPKEEALSDNDANSNEDEEDREEFTSLATFSDTAKENKLEVTESGLLLYSEANRKAGDCEGVFADALDEAYELHRTDLYISFFRY